MKKIFFTALTLFALAGSELKAQALPGIDTSASVVPTTVSMNSTYVFMASVINYGAAYTGTLEVFYAVDSSANNGALQILAIDSASNVNFPPSGHWLDSTNITIDSAHFRTGINTVVIWPRTYPGNNTNDSMKINILVTGLASVNDFTQTRPIVFPNPAQQLIYVVNNQEKYHIEQVRIFDVMGQMVHSTSFNGQVDLSDLPRGVYSLEFSNKDGKTCRHKVIKE